MSKWRDRLIDGQIAAGLQMATDLLDDLERKGVRLTRQSNGVIHVSPASRLDDDDRARIRAHKASLIVLLLTRDLRNAKH